MILRWIQKKLQYKAQQEYQKVLRLEFKKAKLEHKMNMEKKKESKRNI